jgi:hypothetical protein
MRRTVPILLLLLLLGLLPAAPAAAQSDSRCFPETGYCIAGAIRAYWERNGGLAIFGYPISELSADSVYDEFGNFSWNGALQWFERDRLEDHSGEGLGVLAGRLGAEQLHNLTVSLIVPRPAPLAQAAPGCRLFPETGHTLCEPFLSYWQNSGGLARFGYPLSELMDLTVGAWSGRVQFFERRRLELHQFLPSGTSQVMLGLLGNELRSGVPSAPCTGAQLPTALQQSFSYVPFRFQMGCPLTVLSDVIMAEEYFERGTMVWVASMESGGDGLPAIYVTRTSPLPLVGWRFTDTAAEGGTPPPPLTPPVGLYEPIRGFGKVWREQPGVREALGWATEPERAERGLLIPFTSGGALVWLQSKNFVYVYGPGGLTTTFSQSQWQAGVR